MLQAPRLPRESSGRAAETKERQSVHQTPCSAASPTPATRKSGRAAETKERQSVHQTPCSAASPTPATRKQRQRSGDQGAPKRTSDCSAASPTPATRKQRQSSGDQGAPKRTSDPLQRSKSHACHAKAAAEKRRPRSAKAYIRPLQCSKSHACHAKAAAEQRRPRGAKAYIRPPAVQQVPRLPRESSGRAAETKERQSVHQTPCSAASPTPATRKQRQSSGDQGAPKRTSDPLQCSNSHACHAKAGAEQQRPRSAKAYIRPPAAQQVPRLPRESSGRAAETKERQSVHQTPCSAASPTPATRKQRQSSGDQGAPKRTSDPLQCSKSHACHAKAAAEQRRPRSAKAYIRPPAAQQVPRLPRKSRGRAAETKERQSVHQTPCSAASP